MEQILNNFNEHWFLSGGYFTALYILLFIPISIYSIAVELPETKLNSLHMFDGKESEERKTFTFVFMLVPWCAIVLIGMLFTDLFLMMKHTKHYEPIIYFLPIFMIGLLWLI